MSPEIKCPRCGSLLAAEGWTGMCPVCAFQEALEAGKGRGQVEEPDPLLPPQYTLPRGSRIHYFGDYELVEELSRGGMGIVYRARQVSLNREVALKMIRAGRFATVDEVKRFHSEAEAVARLQHPHIVAIHEVGNHEEQHYFSMDLVEGKDLGELVRIHPLAPLQAARYLKVISEAIHYAHSQHVLHRDLKPSNVIIDGNDEPRITDFGLAKQLKSDSELTLSGQVLGTPNFMSPEQAAGRKTEIGPQTDIYSLGAVLYHCLTGRPPFMGESLQALLSMVLQNEPVPLCALNPAVSVDLETICLKCLEKDLARRYGSARELAEELGRFIRGEPILARPVSAVEKGWRWCQRNRALAGSLGLTALLLLVSAIGSSLSAWHISKARKAERQARLRAVAAEKDAEGESRKNREVAQFLKDMLSSVGPSVARGRDTKLLREILEKTSDRLDKELKAQPGVEADLRHLLGNVYEELGEYGKAEAAHRAALALQRTLPAHADLNEAAILNDLGNALAREAKYQEAEACCREALAIRQKMLGREHVDVAQTLNNLGSILWRQSKLAEAEVCYREALTIYKSSTVNEDPKVAATLGNLGNLYGAQGRPAEAESMFREALALQKTLLGNEHPMVAKSLSNLGTSLSGQGKHAEAEPLFREALALRRKLLGEEHPDIAITLNNLGIALAAQGKLEEAEGVHRQALAMRRRLLGNGHPDTAISLNSLGDVLRAKGEVEEAEAVQREGLAIRQKLLGNEPGTSSGH